LGIIGGNSFLTILKRSFLGSLILSSLISGAFYIIKKIISEISASDIGEGQPEQDIDSDPKNIDIVLDQENPFEAEDEDTSPDSISKIGASSSAESLVEEVAEDALGDISSLEIKTNDNEVIEVMNDNSNNNGSMQSLDSNADLFGDLDTQASSSNKKENQVLNSLGENATPQIIAKAIKTVLTRDNNKG